MKRELGIARCGLACCLCSENTMCDGCDSGNVRTKTGAKTENVLFPGKSDIVMSAPENAEKDY